MFFPGDGSLVLGTDAPDGVAELFEVAEQLYLAAEQPVSPQGYTIAGAIIVPFDQAGPHPGRGLALSARSLWPQRNTGTRPNICGNTMSANGSRSRWPRRG